MKHKGLKILLWTARIWGVISLAFLIFMVGAHVIGAFSESGEGFIFESNQELFSFLLFPVITMFGIVLAFNWKGLGGIITTLGIIGFHFLRPDLIFDPMIDGLAVPGFLFLMYWFLSRNKEYSK